MTLIPFREANTADLAWINPDNIGYVRKTIDGEAGNTLIMFLGMGLYVKDEVSAVLDRLRRVES